MNHASHNLTFDSNVAFNTSGHCYLLEEGGEENNTWINNIGALTNTGDSLLEMLFFQSNLCEFNHEIDPFLMIFIVTVKISPDETDNRTTTFWITNLRNSFIGNVAAGSSESG